MNHTFFNGQRVEWFEAGQGETLLFVHGFPLDHTMWTHQLDDFAADYRVIAIDLPGFGGSDPNANLSSLADAASVCHRLIEELQIDRLTYVGLSMGGYIGWEFASRYADQVERLVMMDTRAQADPDEVSRGRKMMAEKLDREGGTALPEIANNMITKLFALNSLRESRWEVEQTREIIQNSSPPAVAQYQRAMATREDFSGRLAEFKMPALFVCGEHDSISTVEEMRTLSRQVPQGTFAEIPDAGHMAPLECPERVNSILRKFLAKPRE